MQSDPYYKFINGVLRRILESTLNLFAFSLPKHKEVLIFKSEWTQLVKIKLPVANTLAYLSCTPEPAIPMVYSSVCVRQQIVKK